jgi:hypothetical protein
MKIDHYIEQLSLNEDCFTLIGLGGFICNSPGAQIRPETHNFIPPARKIVFNSSITNRDFKLENLIAASENISVENAKNAVEHYVNNIQETLSSSNSFEIQNIGRFYKNHSDNLEFEQNTTSNILDDSFGLPELFFKPIERQTMRNRPSKSKKQEEQDPQTGRKHKRKYAIALLPLAFLFVIGALIYTTQDQDSSFSKLLSIGSITGLMDTSSSSSISALKEGAIAPGVSEEFSIEIKEEEIEERGINMVTENEAEATSFYEESVSDPVEVSQILASGDYTIVIGAFSQKDNADKLYNILSVDQVTANIIEPSNTSSLYKVSIGNFANFNAAIQDLEKIRSQYNADAWVMAVK